jgi:hypothetical protein
MPFAFLMRAMILLPHSTTTALLRVPRNPSPLRTYTLLNPESWFQVWIAELPEGQRTSRGTEGQRARGAG